MLKFLVGSHNYNLNTEESDKDWKVFLYPTFDNLYKGTYNTRPTIITEDEDVETKDIRQMLDLFYKCNPAYFELLYSKETDHSDNMEDSKFLKYIMRNRDGIIFHNLPKFFSACMGTYNQKRSSLLKGTSGTVHLMEKFGYDTKAGTHAFRNLDIIERLYVIVSCVVSYRIAHWVHLFNEDLDAHKNRLIQEILNGYKSKITWGDSLKSIYEILLSYGNLNNVHSEILKGDFLPEIYKDHYENLYSFLMDSEITIWDIKDGKYSYNEFINLLNSKESRVNKLKNERIFSKDYINFNVLNQAKEILQRETLENLIKFNIRTEVKYTQDIKPEEEYLLRIDTSETESIWDEDVWGDSHEITYTDRFSHLIKIREDIKNPILDISRSLLEEVFKPKEE